MNCNITKPGLLFLFFLSIVNYSWAQKTIKHPVIHDPVMIKQDNTYYAFSTGMGIAMLSSKDMVNWKREKSIFNKPPKWAVEAVKDFNGHIWAPDIYYHNGIYYLYYSVSSFAKNTSCIGVATNKTLNPESTDYKWIDHEKVIQSVPGRDMWNAIDPNISRDKSGNHWLAFGSFWNGLKLVKLSPDLKSIAQPEEWYTLSSRPRSFEIPDKDPGDAAVEAPFIFQKGDYYYLFVSFDFCCRGIKSTYKIMVGRSSKITGPYIDKEGKRMDQGGGTLVVNGDTNWPGVGHNSAYTFDGKDYLVFHGYDAKDSGKPKLLISIINWDNEGWPSISL